LRGLFNIEWNRDRNRRAKCKTKSSDEGRGRENGGVVLHALGWRERKEKRGTFLQKK